MSSNLCLWQILKRLFLTICYLGGMTRTGSGKRVKQDNNLATHRDVDQAKDQENFGSSHEKHEMKDD